jgi:light-regulated signal transduction histidine kinase (bacteriophytochrome)
MLERCIEESGAEVIDEGLPEVLGDRSMLTQLYQNLISNAIKFAGPVRPIIRLTAERQESGWTLGVRDNGIGIDPLHAQRIFDPFKRLHGRSQYDGSGLGLAVCRRIVRRHGGNIWVELDVEQGAYVKFTLPNTKR